MKRRLEDHQDLVTSTVGAHQQRHRAKEVGTNLRAPGTGHLIKNTGGPAFNSEAVKSESMQGSIQYSMSGFQMTSGMGQGPSGPVGAGGGSPHVPGMHLHHAHGAIASSLHATAALPAVQPQGQAPPQQLQQQQHQQQFQRLKVEDALSYLDQVKFKFGNQPQVYNDFLEIMKEFKSQSIDTPGVIARVSHLFKGHPELIVGFNTFLPPGYRIEVQANEQVNVSMPGSLTTILNPPPPTPPTVAPVVAPVVAAMPVVANAAAPAHVYQASAAAQVKASTHLSSPTSVSSHPSPPSQHSYLHSPTSHSPPNMPSLPGHAPLPLPSPQPPAAQQTSQPVEFNHAINYVNKIKNRFQGQPDIYKQFLEILHTYQKEQRNLKEGVTTGTKPLTEAEVYQQVAKLFQNQDDLLQEFGQFLPDANGTASLGDVFNSLKVKKVPTTKTINNNENSAVVKKPILAKPANIGVSGTSNNIQPKQPLPIKRPTSSTVPVLLTKKPKIGTLKDVTLAEAGKCGTLNDYAFFDKVRKALRSQEVYENFLRCLILFNQEILARSELVQLVTPFLGKFPELFKWFKDFLGYRETGSMVEPVPQRVANQERVSGDLAMEIDYSTCRRLGASYCALPKSYVQPKCTGRTALCKEVLNDTWVSFPSWSEDSTFVSSRKTQFEEYIYRCEDERFELDVVLETNLATIRALEGVQKRLSRLASEEAIRMRLDDSLGGSSQVIHQRTIRRIYGDKSADIVDGLKRNPIVAVPLVLRRLKAKEEEWREAQKNFNKVWRDQNEKYYLKSLDHQGINFKQNDVKALRSKSLLNEIETLYDECHEQAEEGVESISGPHVTFIFKDKSILDDAANLIIHHVKRQTGIHKDDKGKIKHLMRKFVPDLFFHPRQDLSDDEKDNDDVDDVEDASSTPRAEVRDGKTDSSRKVPVTEVASESKNSSTSDGKAASGSQSSDSNKKQGSLPNGDLSDNDRASKEGESLGSDDVYTLFFVNNNWYLFFRLHHILCERLTKIYERSVVTAADEARDRKDRKESTAVALRLKPKSEIEVEEYYPAFLDMVKNLLDGNMESNAYEDTLREMFGIHAYIAFTLDKVVQNVVRQLQHIVCDDPCIRCTEIFLEEQKVGATEGSLSLLPQKAAILSAYQKRVEQLLSDENCFKVTIVRERKAGSTFQFKPESRLTIELLDTDSDASEDPVEVEKWSEYVDKYVSAADNASQELKEQMSDKPIFLPRNVRTWRMKAKRQHEMSGEQNDKSDSKREGSSKEAEGGVEDLEVYDNTHCKFNLNSFKMVYVVGSEGFLYKRQALKRAKQCHKTVSDRLNGKFWGWHRRVADIDADKQEACNEWLMGRAEGQLTNRTKIRNDNDQSREPYHPFNRYHVEWVEKAS